MKQRQRRVDLFSVRAKTPIFCPRASAFLVLGPLKRKIVKSLNCVRLFVTAWTVAPQAPPSMEFSRQEYWSGFPSPSPGDLPDPGIEPGSPTLQADSLLSEPPGKQVLLIMLTGTILTQSWLLVGLGWQPFSF